MFQMLQARGVVGTGLKRNVAKGLLLRGCC
jgi:hypothetical protein